MEFSAENRILAIDFDGTIVEHRYPKIGKEIPFAIETLKELNKKGFRLILWTYRANEYLQEAVDYCSSRGLEFYAVNKNYPEEVFDENISRKIEADIYIDDRNFGGLKDWGEIYNSLCPEEANNYSTVSRKGILGGLFKPKSNTKL